jgi:hypothetical protein
MLDARGPNSPGARKISPIPPWPPAILLHEHIVIRDPEYDLGSTGAEVLWVPAFFVSLAVWRGTGVPYDRPVSHLGAAPPPTRDPLLPLLKERTTRFFLESSIYGVIATSAPQELWFLSPGALRPGRGEHMKLRQGVLRCAA